MRGPRRRRLRASRRSRPRSRGRRPPGPAARPSPVHAYAPAPNAPSHVVLTIRATCVSQTGGLQSRRRTTCWWHGGRCPTLSSLVWTRARRPRACSPPPDISGNGCGGKPPDAEVVGQPWTLFFADWSSPHIRKDVNIATTKTGPLARQSSTSARLPILHTDTLVCGWGDGCCVRHRGRHGGYDPHDGRRGAQGAHPRRGARQEKVRAERARGEGW